MFLEANDGSSDLFAISQPAHAWISGQLLRQWAVELDQPVLLAADQHDLAWLDWERAPSFDAATGRPHLFRDIGAAEHAPRWLEAVERAYASWGSRVALLVSRHGSVIYTRFTDRHRTSDADGTAAADYVAQQTPVQAAWARGLGLPAETLERDTDLIAFADTLSLALCGALPLPLSLEGPAAGGGNASYRLARTGGTAFSHTLDPWPFRSSRIVVTAEARRLPGGCFAGADAMRAWLASEVPRPLHFTVTPEQASSTIPAS